MNAATRFMMKTVVFRVILATLASLCTGAALASTLPDSRTLLQADVDDDQIPDYRDVCLPPDSDVLALTRPGQLATALPKSNRRTRPNDPDVLQALGCKSEDTVVLYGIRFESGQSYLNVASRQVLDRLAYALQRLPDARFEIQAHTDNAGRVEHNQTLSSRRARTIRDYLILRGVAGEQLRARGLGETSPAYDNTLAAGRRANRRVELTIVVQ